VEESERYRVTLTPAAGAPRAVETGLPELFLTVADRADGDLEIEVRQLGTHGASLPARLTVSGI
jgi:hypothetical protein